MTRNAILRDDHEIIRIYRRMAIKDATKMVAQAEEGIKLTQQEERLANVMVNGTSNLARNMAAEFMKTRGNQEEPNNDRVNKIKEQANIELSNRRRARRALMKDEFDDLAECMPRGHTRRVISSSDDGSDHHAHHRSRKHRKTPRHRVHQHHALHSHHNKRRKAKRDQQHIANLISREYLPVITQVYLTFLRNNRHDNTTVAN